MDFIVQNVYLTLRSVFENETQFWEKSSGLFRFGTRREKERERGREVEREGEREERGECLREEKSNLPARTTQKFIIWCSLSFCFKVSNF